MSESFKPETDGDDGSDFVIHWSPHYEMRGTQRVRVFSFDKERTRERTGPKRQ